MNEQGVKVLDTKQLFFAPGTWTLPALSHGLLYIVQNETDRSSGKSQGLYAMISGQIESWEQL